MTLPDPPRPEALHAIPALDAGQAKVYPARRAARDAFVLASRTPHPRPDASGPAALLVEDERAADGQVVRTAAVFLVGRECPWRCVMCDLWRHTTLTDTPVGAIPRQVTQAVAEIQRRQEPVRVLKLYNAGSFFDRRAVPTQDDAAIVDAVAAFRHIVVESHPALIGDRTWRLRDALARRGVTLEVAMGLETAHPAALVAINKGITPERFAVAAERLQAQGVALRTFLLIHPPFVPRDEQDAWLSRSVTFAEGCGATAISLIPTRDGEGAMQALTRHGVFTPPRLCDVEQSIAAARAATRQRVFVDLWDVARLATCTACGDTRVERLRRFNLTQVLTRPAPCVVCGEAVAA